MKNILLLKLTALIATMLFSVSVQATNSGYANITEVKSWQTFASAVLTVDHNCGTNGSHYRLSFSYKEEYALLLTAFSLGYTVNVFYNCDSQGYAQITGIRARP